MKKLLSLLLALFLICPACSGCTAADTAPEPSGPLRVLFDFSGPVSFPPEIAAAKIFLGKVAEYGGPEDIEVEYLPGDEEERAMALTRLRTEIMSGKGPDVFILRNTARKWDKERLFPYPQKLMAGGMFLELDNYMEKAEHTDWSKLTPQVMEAGKYNGKQVLVPLGYSFNCMIAKQEDISPFSTHIPWMEAVNSDDPIVRRLAACDDSSGFYGVYISDILGELADYETEQLLFTQEELEAVIFKAADLLLEDAFTEDLPELPKFIDTSYRQGYTHYLVTENNETYVGYSGAGDPLTILPMMNLKGGVTASATSFAAISASTKRPEDAFLLLDVLLCPEVACSFSQGYTVQDWLTEGQAVPIHSELMREDRKLGTEQWYLNEENFSELCRAREEITTAKIVNHLDLLLSDLYFDCGTLAFRWHDGEMTEEEYRASVKEKVSAAYREMQMRIAES